MEVVVQTSTGEAELLLERGDGGDVSIGDVVVAVTGRTPAALSVDGRAVATTASLAVAGVRRGSVVQVDHASIDPDPAERGAAVELVTIAGVGAGRRRQLATGRYRIGPGMGDRELDDGIVDDPRWRLVVLGAGMALPRLVELEDRVVELRHPRSSMAGAERRRTLLGPADEDGTLAFNRPPRPATSDDDDPIVVPESTRRRDERGSFPVLAMLAPLPIAVAMAAMLGSWRYALFGLLSPVMILANTVEDRRTRRRDGRRANAADRIAARQIAVDIAERQRDAAERARSAHPDLAELLTWMHDAHPRLWERRPDHHDALVVPIGWGDQPWRPPLDRRRGALDVQALLDAHAVLPGVPVTVDLRNGTGVAFVGPTAAARGAVGAAILAMTALHGPADLTIVVCVDPTAASEWEWTKWLPHTRGDGVRLVTDPTAPIELPDAESDDARRPSGPPRHCTVVVADGTRWWHGRDAPLRHALGRADVRLVALVEQEPAAPSVCATVVTLPEKGRATVHHVPTGTTTTALVNRVEPDVALTAARRLARLDDPERRTGAVHLPSGTVSLLDELALQPPSIGAIRGRWVDPGRRPATPLGVTAGGVVRVDLVMDGPHALIAGTTGSGKSELLRSLVAGLAATLPPAELNIVLIDFKGGAAFDACARLPHTVGLVTDLDEHLAARMLRSLRAEIRHRERLLRDAGVSSLEALAAERGPDAMARLLIVADEFAALAGQLPDFVPGLVDIAQRGRSLGIHLVLATQRPAGVVDNKIRANTNLRIALRVHDDADSFDVIGTRDAIAIPRRRPGRAIIRFGAGELVELQTALASASAPAGRRPAVRAMPYVVARPLSALERRLDDEPGPRAATDCGATDLDRLVDTVVAAAGPVTLRRPCLDPLPTLVRLADLPTDAEPEGTGVPLAVVDRPDEQRWSVRTWRPEPAGSLGVIGATGSGTSSALLTLALGVTATASPDDVHLYLIDADTGRLAPLQALPHVGAVVAPDDPARIARLVRVLGQEIGRRREPGPGGHPAIAVLIDNIASLRQTLDEDRRWRDVWPGVERLARDGAAVGITMVVTASHERGLPGSISAHLRERLVLRLADPVAYAAFGLRPSEVTDLPPGRAIDPATRLEQQLLAPPADLAGAVAATVARWGRPRRPPRAVGPLPTRLAVAEVVAHGTKGLDGWSLPIGLDERDGAVATLPVRRGHAVGVYGPPGSGRTSTLRTLLTGLARVDPAAGRYALGPDRRLVDLAVAPEHPSEVAAWVDAVLTDDRPRLVVIDDADELDGPSVARLTASHDPRLALVLAGSPDGLRRPDHWARPRLRTRTGILLGASGGDGDVLRVMLPLSGAPTPVGRGHAVVDGEAVPVLLAEGTAVTAAAPGGGR